MFFATFYIIANIFQSYELWLLYRCFFGKSKRGAGIEFQFLQDLVLMLCLY